MNKKIIKKSNSWHASDLIASDCRGLYGITQTGTIVTTSDYYTDDIASWRDIVSVSCGSSHIVGLTYNGRVLSAGRNYHGQCNTYGWTDIVSIKAWDDITLGVTKDGYVLSTGEIRNPNPRGFRAPILIPFITRGLKNIVFIDRIEKRACSWSRERYDMWLYAAEKSGDTICYEYDSNSNSWKKSYSTDKVELNQTVASNEYKDTIRIKADGTVAVDCAPEKMFGFDAATRSAWYNVVDWTDIIAVFACGQRMIGIQANGKVLSSRNDAIGQTISSWKLFYTKEEKDALREEQRSLENELSTCGLFELSRKQELRTRIQRIQDLLFPELWSISRAEIDEIRHGLHEIENAERRKELEAEATQRKAEIIRLLNQINTQIQNFNKCLTDFFAYPVVVFQIEPYKSTEIQLDGYIAELNQLNLKLNKYGLSQTRLIEATSVTVNAFNELGHRVNQLPLVVMTEPYNYGKRNAYRWDNTRNLSKQYVDKVISQYETFLDKDGGFLDIYKIDIQLVLDCIWFYATAKPYSQANYNRAVAVFERVYRKSHIDIVIAELYAKMQIGGENALHEQIGKILQRNFSAEELHIIASSLMWMNAYRSEHMVLQHMLEKGLQMPAKAQERLHSLANIGGKAPIGFDVVSTENVLFFDVTALTWKDNEYQGFFDNLAFQEKQLSYSLAIRDETKELFTAQKLTILQPEKILSHMDELFRVEYGDVVSAKQVTAVALAGSGAEDLACVLITSSECKHLGLLVHTTQIGKRLRIKFYTLFMPDKALLESQKQHALSMYQKLSPTITGWESSIKDTALIAIQQLLNTSSVNSTSADDSLLF